jgi:GNAT superfamily N-acetyltransferase
VGETPLLRSAGEDDAVAVVDLVAEGFEGYREFGPPGWVPPDERSAEQTEKVRAFLADPRSFGLLAEDDGGRAVGVVLWTIAPDEPGCAHLRHLFIRSSHWGTGLAVELHKRAMDAARERGWRRMRLFTPAQQARARRFYEREGWTLSREPFEMEGLGLVAVEYRRELSG